MTRPVTLYTISDLSKYCEVKHDAVCHRFKRGRLPEPVAHTASGKPLWSAKQADEIRKGEYRKRIDITGM